MNSPKDDNTILSQAFSDLSKLNSEYKKLQLTVLELSKKQAVSLKQLDDCLYEINSIIRSYRMLRNKQQEVIEKSGRIAETQNRIQKLFELFEKELTLSELNNLDKLNEECKKIEPINIQKDSIQSIVQIDDHYLGELIKALEKQKSMY
ncbi:hypothetical protein QTN25_001353 [Entamoeba marina]